VDFVLVTFEKFKMFKLFLTGGTLSRAPGLAFLLGGLMAPRATRRH
jgi:hypothetical protein